MTKETTQTTLGASSPSGVFETYVTALQHDTAGVPPNATCVGVVRQPMYGLTDVVQENHPYLGPPAQLLDTIKDTYQECRDTGMDDVEAHNTACQQHDLANTYREYLTDHWSKNDPVYKAGCRILALSDTQPVAVVCYEADGKTCHRHVLQDFLQQKRTTVDVESIDTGPK